MSGVIFRPDYAKFIFVEKRGEFDLIMQRIHKLSHERKFHGDWLRSHNVQALQSMSLEYDTTILEIWGEWAGLVRDMPYQWIGSLTRFDVRATLWNVGETDIVNTGQHLQRTITTHNVNVYSTRPASKRKGRSRGGKGFAIGSHKSDIRVAVYKRKDEPAAVEFQISGDVLVKLRGRVLDKYSLLADVTDVWQVLVDYCVALGDDRMTAVYRKAGIGSYWPVVDESALSLPKPAQRTFTDAIAPQNEEEEYLAYLCNYGDPREAL